MTNERCTKCGRLKKKTGEHTCPNLAWNKEFLRDLSKKSIRCEKCGLIKKKDGTHICQTSVWNKGGKGLQIAWNKGKKHSQLTKTKLSETRIKKIKDGSILRPVGKNNGMYGKEPWNKKYAFLTSQIRHLSEYTQWRLDTFKRDDFTCQDCGLKTKDIQAHHIKPFFKILRENKINSVNEARLCEELWDLTNGKTLCTNCHLEHHFHLSLRHKK